MDPTEAKNKAVPATPEPADPGESEPGRGPALIESIDPIAVGGAVGGMTAGEVIGGAIGGLLGAVAGPGGAVIGAGLGAFAGSTVGAKLGYDVTHELAHPEDAHASASLGDRRAGSPRAPPPAPATPLGVASVPRGVHWSAGLWPAR